MIIRFTVDISLSTLFYLPVVFAIYFSTLDMKQFRFDYFLKNISLYHQEIIS